MATQAQLDAVKALIAAGDFDAARTAFREEWDELFLNFAMDLLVGGSNPVVLTNNDISESWNLHLSNADSFGANSTYLYAVPTIDQGAVIIPVTSVFVPPQGYIWHVKNGSTTNRLTIDPQDSATIDGAGTIDIEPGGSIRLMFDNVSGRELSVLAASATRKYQRVGLGAADTAAGLLSWQNPFGAPILVSIVVDITTPATGAHVSQFGQAATAAASGTLLDNIDTGTAATVYSSPQPATGKRVVRVGTGEYVTGSTNTGAAAGMVGNAFIEYMLA